jgi:hypothetical protein
MRMQTRVMLASVGIVLAGLAVATVLIATLPKTSQPLAGLAFLVVSLALAIAQLAWLICPHCKITALRTPAGTWTPFVGKKCRYCHRHY